MQARMRFLLSDSIPPSRPGRESKRYSRSFPSHDPGWPRVRAWFAGSNWSTDQGPPPSDHERGFRPPDTSPHRLTDGRREREKAVLMISSRVRKYAGQVREITPHQVLVAIDHLQSLHLGSAATEEVFAGLLADLLTLSNSSTATLAEVEVQAGGGFVLGRRLRLRANGGILAPDSPEVEALLEQVLIARGAIFGRLPRLRFWEPADGDESADLLGLPLASGDSLLAVAALAGRPGGYDEELVEFLRPLLVTATVLVQAHQQERQHRRRGELLRESEQRLRKALASPPYMDPDDLKRLEEE